GYAARLYDYFGKDTRLVEISSDRIAQYKTQREQDGLKPASINRELALLRGAFELAVHTWKWARVNPVSEAGLVPGEEERTRWINEAEERSLFAVCPEWLAAISRLVLH